MNKAEFIKFLQKKTGWDRDTCKMVLRIVLESIVECVGTYGYLHIRGFGRFQAKLRKGYARINGVTKKPEMINATPYVKFSAGLNFVNRMHDITLKIKNGKVIPIIQE